MRRRRIEPVRIFAAGLAGLLILLILAAGTVLKWPGLLLNDRTLGLAHEYILKHGLSGLTWKDGKLEASSKSLLKKRVAIRLGGVCYDAPDVVRVCFDTLAL